MSKFVMPKEEAEKHLILAPDEKAMRSLSLDELSFRALVHSHVLWAFGSFSNIDFSVPIEDVTFDKEAKRVKIVFGKKAT